MLTTYTWNKELTCALSKVLPNEKIKRENSANKRKS